MNELDKIYDKMKTKKVINNSNEKSTTIIGNIDNNKIIIHYKPKNNNIFSKNINNCVKVLDNNRFQKYECSCDDILFDVSAINPALPEDIYKFSPSNKIRITESYQDYINNVYPKIVNQDRTWIYNILDGKSEQDDIIFENDYFVLLPDIKWDKKDMDCVYCLAIVKDRTIKSIRDLNGSHINLLKNIFHNSTKTMEKLYNVKSNRIRAYFHYHPSFWHLHVHFNLINIKSGSASSDAAHPLWNVIRNIELVDDYYQTVDIDVIMKI